MTISIRMGRMFAPHFFSSHILGLIRKGHLKHSYALLAGDWTRISSKLSEIPVADKEMFAWLCQINNDLPKAESLFAAIPLKHRSPDLILNQATLYLNAEKIEEGLRILLDQMPESHKISWQYFHNLLGALYRIGRIEEFTDLFKKFYSKIDQFANEDLVQMIPSLRLCDRVHQEVALMAWTDLEKRNAPSLNHARILRELNLGNIKTAENLINTLDLLKNDLRTLKALSALRSGRPEETLSLLSEVVPAGRSELDVLTLAQAQRDLGYVDGARQTLLQIDMKANIKARALLASVEIYSGNLANGFDLMSESQTDELLLHKYDVPYITCRWRGDNNANLLLLADQGLGDQIIFGSCLDDLLSEHSGKICLLIDERLCQLFQRTFPELGVFSSFRQIKTTGTDQWVFERLSRLTTKYRRSFSQFSGRGYQRRKLITMDRQLALKNVNVRSKCVGISWKTTRLINKAKRDAKLEQWLDLLRDLHVQVINLQYDTSPEEWSMLRGLGNLIEHDVDLKEDIESVGKLMEKCNLVVTIGNTNAYLAGALDIRTLVVLPVAPRDVWFAERETSPWFRQTHLLRNPSPLSLKRTVSNLLG